MTDKDKEKKDAAAEKTPAAAPQSLRLGTLNTHEDDFISRKLPSGPGTAESVMAAITGRAYEPNLIDSEQEFVGIVMRVVPQPYNITPQLGPYFRVY